MRRHRDIAAPAYPAEHGHYRRSPPSYGVTSIVLLVLCSILAICHYSLQHSSVGALLSTAVPAAQVTAMVNEKAGRLVKWDYPTPGSRSKRPKDDPFWKKFHDISIVYTYVNGSDPDFVALKEKYGRKGSSSRYRDTEELLHSLRSLDRHMPWHTGKIFIVTPGHLPYWLNLSHPRVVPVNQNDIIPKEAQPAFNSAVIEQSMWRIPGLTDIFVHINDDYLFGKDVHPSDFITDNGGVRLYHESNVIRGGYEEYKKMRAERRKQWLASVFHTNALLTKALGPRRRYFVKHAPFVYHRKAFEYLFSIWGDELRAASKMRFRHYDDVLVPFLHHNWLKVEGPKYGLHFDDHVGNNDLDSILCIVHNDITEAHRKMSSHIRVPHQFFTVNDGWSAALPTELVLSFFHTLWPEPSQFEINGAVPRHRPELAMWSHDLHVMSKRCAAALAKRAGAPVEVPSIALGMNECGDECSGHGECTSAGCVCHDGWTGTYCSYSLPPKTKTFLAAPACDSVDVVFTWVNGSHPVLQKEVAAEAVEKHDVNRVRDLGQLRFGLRSILTYLPWVRHIWVVSGTPCPSWLDSEHPRVTYIPHSMIFKENELPQLNSNSIQARLYTIPGLALRYVSMDDDYLFTRPTPPSAILGSDHRSTRQFYRGAWNKNRHIRGPFRDALMHTRELIFSRFQRNDLQLLTAAHVPPVIDRIVQAEVQKVFRSEFDILPSSKHRQSTDFEPNFGFAWYLQAASQLGAGTVSAVEPILAGQTVSPTTALGGIGREDLICRIAGLHPKHWPKRTQSLMEKELTPLCINGSSEACDEALKKALTKVVYTYEKADKQEVLFEMLRVTTDVGQLKEKLQNGKVRIACLNDDYPSNVAENVVESMKAMHHSLGMGKAPWELD